MRAAEHPELAPYVGQELIVTDGTSVLGADNKAAVANVMTALATLAGDASIPHGDIYVSFVPDEECGLWGSKNMDFTKFPVAYAYTIDCCALGEVVYETFNAGSAAVTIQGVSAHPMSAKGVLVNPTLLAVDFVNLFDRKETPECTEGTEGYIWCQTIRSNPTIAVVELNIRDHDKARYEGRKRLILENIEKLRQLEPRCRVTYTMEDTYGNIADAVTDENRSAIDNIYEAMERLGITPKTIAMRGGRAQFPLQLRVPADLLPAQILRADDGADCAGIRKGALTGDAGFLRRISSYRRMVCRHNEPQNTAARRPNDRFDRGAKSQHIQKETAAQMYLRGSLFYMLRISTSSCFPFYFSPAALFPSPRGLSFAP